MPSPKPLARQARCIQYFLVLPSSMPRVGARSLCFSTISTNATNSAKSYFKSLHLQHSQGSVNDSTYSTARSTFSCCPLIISVQRPSIEYERNYLLFCSASSCHIGKVQVPLQRVPLQRDLQLCPKPQGELSYNVTRHRWLC